MTLMGFLKSLFHKNDILLFPNECQKKLLQDNALSHTEPQIFAAGGVLYAVPNRCFSREGHVI